VTTTTASTGAKALIDSLDKSNGGEIHTAVWDSTELAAFLLQPANHDLVEQFLPGSYKRLKELTSLEGALLAFRDQLPEEVLAEVLDLVRPYSQFALRGSKIWPYDAESASAIDRIIMYVITKPDLHLAVQATEEIEADAFIALLTRLHSHYPSECFHYLSAIVTEHHEYDIRFNAAQFLFDNYEINPSDAIRFATSLDPASLAELYGSEVAYFVTDELVHKTPAYELYSAIDELSSSSSIEDLHLSSLEFHADTPERVEFSGKLIVEVSLEFDGDRMGNHIFPGTFSGHFDEYGMCLEHTSLDTSAFWQ
jgi:hypothetical protein